MNRVKIYITFVLCFLLSSCTIENPADIDNSPGFGISSESGAIGDTVYIYSKKSFGSLEIKFNEADWISSNKINDSSFASIIPFGALDGNITLRNSEETYNPEISFDVIDEYDPEKFSVVWFNLSDSVTQYNSCVHYPYKESNCWKKEYSGDTLILKLSNEASEAPFVTELKFLDNGKNTLPTFLQLKEIQYFDYPGGPRVEYIDKGIIKIFKWDITTIVSGRVFEGVYGTHQYFFNFYFDFTKI